MAKRILIYAAIACLIWMAAAFVVTQFSRNSDPQGVSITPTEVAFVAWGIRAQTG